MAALGLLAGVATGRVDLIVLACSFVVFVLVALATSDRPFVDVAVEVEPRRSIEGDPIDVTVRLHSPTGASRVDVALVLPAGVRTVDGEQSTVTHLEPGETRELRHQVVADGWGAYELGTVVLRVHDRLSLFVREQRAGTATTVRFYPEPQRLTRLARPVRTQLFAGDRVARRAASEGIELADLRMFMPGDRPKDVNWRASARRGELWVTQRHPERSTDVVVFVDLFSDAMLLRAVRAAAAIADSYLVTRDRVGLVGFGGVVQWVGAGQGVRQTYRLLDTLLDARTYFSYAWKDVSIIPPHVLVPRSLVIAVTPLEDERTMNALVDLRARGYEVAIVELVPDVPIGAGTEASSDVDVLTRRFWHLQREHRRAQFRQFGIPVAPWSGEEPLSVPMEVLWFFSEGRGAGLHA